MSSTTDILPPLPPRPATYHNTQVQLVSKVPPTCFCITAFASAIFAGINYYELGGVNILQANAGFLTIAAVVLTSGSLCFWKYVGAKAIEQSAGDMRATVEHLSALNEKLEEENQAFRTEVVRLNAGIATWTKNEDANTTIYDAGTKSLNMTADTLGQLVDKLEKYFTLDSKFKESIGDLKGILRDFANVTPDFKKRMLVIKDQTEAISDLPAKMEVNITSIDAIDEELLHAIAEFKDYIEKFESCAKEIVDIFEKTKKEQDTLGTQLVTLKRENEHLKGNLDKLIALTADFQDRIPLIQQFLAESKKQQAIQPQSSPQADPSKKRKKRTQIKEKLVS